MTTTTKRDLSPEHKKAMAQGRVEGRIVKRYLEALESTKPRRGRKRTPESVARRLAEIDRELPTADPLRRVTLVQLRMDLQAADNSAAATLDIDELEQEFVAVANAYGSRRGLTYRAWREVGVRSDVLNRAGISR